MIGIVIFPGAQHKSFLQTTTAGVLTWI